MENSLSIRCPAFRYSSIVTWREQMGVGETRRTVKVIGRLPGQRTALFLLWAVLDRAAGDWRGITSPTPPPTSGSYR